MRMPTTWKTQDGRVTLIKFMSDDHLLNTILFIKRRTEEKVGEMYHSDVKSDPDLGSMVDRSLVRSEIYCALVAEGDRRSHLAGLEEKEAYDARQKRRARIRFDRAIGDLHGLFPDHVTFSRGRIHIDPPEPQQYDALRSRANDSGSAPVLPGREKRGRPKGSARKHRSRGVRNGRKLHPIQRRGKRPRQEREEELTVDQRR